MRSVIVAIGLAVGGRLYELSAERHDGLQFQAPGRLIDIGGYRLHLNCVGSGSPAVVIEAGWGDSSADWAGVQAGVAGVTRVCTYDRAGMGWSDVSPHPRTARQFATELHSLLKAADEKGPFVVVAHSMGGFTALVFAHDFPEDMAGLVLVDPQALPPASNTPVVKAPSPGQVSLPVILAQIGVVRLFVDPLSLMRSQPTNQSAFGAPPQVTPRFVQTFLDEGRGMSEGGAQAKAIDDLGALPLIVLSRGKDQTPEWAASQDLFVRLSSSSQQMFADRSGHRIMFEQPEAAIGSILKMVELVRSGPR